ncbi:unnamed protein product [Microthlaspi erraticum]|uniref:Uncharacterized protein n=1 Tax=Microthlaspi erraticum TaxID=1685480 RepID=A0A6D2IFK6_9BRAS|nr:unnamed protein product [Microthlaspi erraticum]
MQMMCAGLSRYVRSTIGRCARLRTRMLDKADVKEIHHTNQGGAPRGMNTDRNKVVRKKPFRSTVAIGGGGMRRLIHVSRTPHKKKGGKGCLLDRIRGKAGKDEDDPTAGKGKGKATEE